MFNTSLRGSSAGSQNGAAVTVYGTRWCGATQGVRRFLDRYHVPYNFRDMDADPEVARQVRWWTGGYESHPTVQVNGNILVEPSLSELQSVLASNGLL